MRCWVISLQTESAEAEMCQTLKQKTVTSEGSDEKNRDVK